MVMTAMPSTISLMAVTAQGGNVSVWLTPPKYCHPERPGPHPGRICRRAKDLLSLTPPSIVILSEAKDLLLLTPPSIVILSEAEDLLSLTPPSIVILSEAKDLLLPPPPHACLASVSK
jgi:hypothetical protein